MYSQPFDFSVRLHKDAASKKPYAGLRGVVPIGDLSVLACLKCCFTVVVDGGSSRSGNPPILRPPLATASRASTAGNDIGIQGDRAIPRQHPAFYIHACRYGNGCERHDVSLEHRVRSQGR